MGRKFLAFGRAMGTGSCGAAWDTRLSYMEWPGRGIRSRSAVRIATCPEKMNKEFQWANIGNSKRALPTDFIDGSSKRWHPTTSFCLGSPALPLDDGEILLAVAAPSPAPFPTAPTR
jgi:hypothetical protein